MQELLEAERSLHRRVRHIDAGVSRPEAWRRILAGESPTRLELRGMDAQGGGDRLECRRDQRQDLVAVARGRADALHVGAGALALRLDAGPVLRASYIRRTTRTRLEIPISVYKSNGGRTTEQDTQANLRTPPLRGEVPY